METKDKVRFAKSMAIMGTAFQKEPTKSVSEIYWRVLQDMKIEVFEQACITLINIRTITGTFPLIAEIRAVANDGQDLETRITIAWDKLLYAVERHGHNDTVLFDDPVIHQIIKSWGGWIKWASEITNDQLKWARKDFVALYKAYSTLSLPDPEPLEGAIALENRNSGWFDFIPEPIFITGNVGNFKSLPWQETQPKQIEAKL